MLKGKCQRGTHWGLNQRLSSCTSLSWWCPNEDLRGYIPWWGQFIRCYICDEGMQEQHNREIKLTLRKGLLFEHFSIQNHPPIFTTTIRPLAVLVSSDIWNRVALLMAPIWTVSTTLRDRGRQRETEREREREGVNDVHWCLYVLVSGKWGWSPLSRRPFVGGRTGVLKTLKSNDGCLFAQQKY